MKMLFSKNKKEYRNILISIGCVCFLYAVLHLLGITCPIKYLTGISCPGCGMSRAYLHLLMFDMQGALYYHPLFFIPPVFCVVYFYKNRLSQKQYRFFVLTIVVIFVIIYIVRLISPNNDIVVCHPHEGKIFQILHYLFQGGR